MSNRDTPYPLSPRNNYIRDLARKLLYYMVMENMGLQIKWTWKKQIFGITFITAGGVFLTYWFKFVCFLMALV